MQYVVRNDIILHQLAPVTSEIESKVSHDLCSDCCMDLAPASHTSYEMKVGYPIKSHFANKMHFGAPRIQGSIEESYSNIFF